MIRVALRGMAGRKLRTVLTAFAIVLGVAMVAGTYILTDTMADAADRLSTESYQGVDAVVSAKKAFDVNTNESFSEPTPLPESVIETVRGVPEAGIVAGDILDTAKVLDKKGKVIGGDGAPSFAAGFDASDPRAAELSPFRFSSGRFPTKGDEVAIDTGTAKDQGFKIGDTISVATRGPVEKFKLVGTANFGSVESLGNASAVILELKRAQELFDKEGLVDSILVGAREGTEPKALQAAIGRALPPSAQVESAEEQDRYDLGGLSEFVDIIQKILLAFGFIALFVGAFIIFNGFSITVAQRTREFALLRTIGASRRQVLGSVMAEALVMAVVASVVGLIAGLGLAKLLQSIFAAIGLDLPQSGTVFATRTIVVSLLLGIIVTVLAGLAPAFRATRTAPVEALRQGVVSAPGRFARFAPYVAIGTILLGLAALAYGMFASDIDVAERLSLLGVGCLVLFIGVALISSRLVRPLASFLGRPAERIGGAAGKLARQNSMRNPSRTATTASALMIGIALVSLVAVMGEGLRNSFGDSLDEQLKTDYVLTADDGFSPFTPKALTALEREPGVESTTMIRQDQALVFDNEQLITALDPRTAAAFLEFDWKDGSDATLGQLGANGAVVNEDFAKDHDLKVGSTFKMQPPTGEALQVTVKGIDAPPPFDPLYLGDVAVSTELFDERFATEDPVYGFVNVSGNVDAATSRGLERALNGFPDAKVLTQAKYKEDIEEEIQGLLGLLYVLLALSVIVSLFGIVNTLVLSVFERTRELGMLRAVGMTRRQVRRMVRHESIVTALIGAVIGIVLGLFLGALVTQALADEGFSFGVPVGTLIAFLIVAVVAGMLAAILPARRASRLNVLEALQYE